MSRKSEVPTRYTFSVSVPSVIMTVIVFTVIFFLIYLNSVRQVRFANPIELVCADKAGEKPPKTNWIVGIPGQQQEHLVHALNPFQKTYDCRPYSA